MLSSQVGQHQHSNAAAAVRALLWLREQEGLAVVDDAAIRKGLECARLPVRFQVLQAPMQSVAGPGIMVLDGAHTPAAAESLATTLRQAFQTEPIALVVAMACDKVRHECLYRGGLSSLYRLCRPCEFVGSLRAEAAGVVRAGWIEVPPAFHGE